MKTKLFALIAAGIFAFTFTYANTDDLSAKERSAKVSQTVTGKIDYPQFAKEANIEGTVFVKFRLLADGSIKVLESYSQSEQLKSYVESELNKMHLKFDKSLVNNNYQMKFSFRLF